MKLITSRKQLEENIRHYAASGDEMADLMAFSRAWYALRTDDGWLLGPSKFIGYEGMDAETYLRERNQGLDGRATERVLEQWSDPIKHGHPQYDELRAALAALFAHHGKTPNTLARISIVRTDGAPAQATPPDELVNLLTVVYRRLPATQDEFVNLLAAVYRRLPTTQQSAFRRIAMSE